MIGEDDKVFVDSNVWLYAFVERQDPAKHEIAQQLTLRPNLAISDQVVREVCRNLLRKEQYTEDEIIRTIRSFYANYEVVRANVEIDVDASRLHQAYSLSYWDSLIVAAALAANASILISEDMHDGLVVDSKLTIMNRFQVR